MTDGTAPAGSGATHAAGQDPLSHLAAARDDWLAAATEVLRRHPWVAGAWLVGSLGRGTGDPFSDVDLVVATRASAPAQVFTDPVGELGPPGTVLFRRTKPSNAPAAGGYLTVCVQLADLPVLVDLYLWPEATAAVPAAARIVYDGGGLRRSELGFIALLESHPNADRTGADPHDPANLLMQVQLATKYFARGNAARLAAIIEQLDAPTVVDGEGLRRILAERVNLVERPDLRAAMAAAHRLISLAEHGRPTPTVTMPAGGGPA